MVTSAYLCRDVTQPVVASMTAVKLDPDVLVLKIKLIVNNYEAGRIQRIELQEF